MNLSIATEANAVRDEGNHVPLSQANRHAQHLCLSIAHKFMFSHSINIHHSEISSPLSTHRCEIDDRRIKYIFRSEVDCEVVKYRVCLSYLSVRLVRTRSCCSNFSFSLDCCCWFCVSTSLLLFSVLVEIHLLPLAVCWLARSICLANCCRIDMLMVTFDNLENIFISFYFVRNEISQTRSLSQSVHDNQFNNKNNFQSN